MSSCVDANRGFTLLEAALAVVVVGLTALFVLRSFSSSLEASRRSKELTLACLLAEEKLWDAGQRLSVNNETDGREDLTLWDKEFSCEWQARENSQQNLTGLELNLSWQGPHQKKYGLQLSTLLRPVYR